MRCKVTTHILYALIILIFEQIYLALGLFYILA